MARNNNSDFESVATVPIGPGPAERNDGSYMSCFELSQVRDSRSTAIERVIVTRFNGEVNGDTIKDIDINNSDTIGSPDAFKLLPEAFQRFKEWLNNNQDEYLDNLDAVAPDNAEDGPKFATHMELVLETPEADRADIPDASDNPAARLDALQDITPDDVGLTREEFVDQYQGERRYVAVLSSKVGPEGEDGLSFGIRRDEFTKAERAETGEVDLVPNYQSQFRLVLLGDNKVLSDTMLAIETMIEQIEQKEDEGNLYQQSRRDRENLRVSSFITGN